MLEIKQDGANFSGSISSQVGNGALENGKVSGKNLVATLKVEVQGQAMEVKLEGTVEGKTMTGVGLPPITFTATKAK